MEINDFVDGMNIFDKGLFTTIEYFESKYGKKEILNPIFSELTKSNFEYYQESTYIFEDKVIRFTKDSDIYNKLFLNPHPNLEEIINIYEYDIIKDSDTIKRYLIESAKYSNFKKEDFDEMDDDRKEKFKNDICTAVIALHKITGLFHYDISFDNIVYNENTDNYILIDYGMMDSSNFKINGNRDEFDSIRFQLCIEEHFEKKYLKYKQKYLLLKKNIN